MRIPHANPLRYGFFAEIAKIRGIFEFYAKDGLVPLLPMVGIVLFATYAAFRVIIPTEVVT